LKLRLLSFVIATVVCIPWSLCAQSSAPATQQHDHLRFVVIVTRHGVRSPTGKFDLLNQYSAQPWPRWNLRDADLSPHGFHLMELMGKYDRALLAEQGLLAPSGCDDAARIRIVADSDQRTRETGRALASGLAPGCTIPVQALPEGTPDALFHPIEAGLGPVDRQRATAALVGRIGNHPTEIAEAYRAPLETLDQLLARCPKNKTCQSRHSLFEIDAAVTPGKSDHLVDLRSPLALASTMTENFLLEYAEGMDTAQVGWGLVDAQKLRSLLALHVAQEDLGARTEPVARAQASNLLFHLLRSAEQAATEHSAAGALTRIDDRLLILSGHDTNLANIAGALHLNWIIDGRRDDTPPGGALVFELWQKEGAAEVRTYYVAQTLEQMRHATPLTLSAPPDRVPVFLPACGRADGSCSLEGFRTALTQAIDTTVVR